MSQNKVAESERVALLTFTLTKGQVHALQMLLPRGFSLQLPPKSTRMGDTTNNSRPTKRVFLEDSSAATREPQSLETIKTALRGKKVRTNYEQRYNEYDALIQSGKIPRSLGEGLRKCYKILQQLKRNPDAAPFLKPVDAEALGIPDYYKIITDPMDISKVEAKLRTGEYTSVSAFAADVRKIWNNSFRYNSQGTDIYLMTSSMSEYFEKLFRELDSGFGEPESSQVMELKRKLSRLQREFKELNTEKTGRPIPIGNRRIRNEALNYREMKPAEKRALGQSIRQLPPEYLRGVWEIVSEEMSLAAHNKEEIEFDIDTLPTHKVRELERYVKNKLALMAKAKARKANSEAAKKNEPALPNTDLRSLPSTDAMIYKSEEKELKKIVPNDSLKYGMAIEETALSNAEVPRKRIDSDSSFMSDSDDSLLDNEHL